MPMASNTYTVAANGLETSAVGSPWLMARVRRSCSSAIGPRMRPITAGAMGYPNLRMT